jgi:hypothetical protein
MREAISILAHKRPYFDILAEELACEEYLSSIFQRGVESTKRNLTVRRAMKHKSPRTKLFLPVGLSGSIVLNDPPLLSPRAKEFIISNDPDGANVADDIHTTVASERASLAGVSVYYLHSANGLDPIYISAEIFVPVSNNGIDYYGRLKLPKKQSPQVLEFVGGDAQKQLRVEQSQLSAVRGKGWVPFDPLKQLTMDLEKLLRSSFKICGQI